jgi:hypothetical protein
MAHGSPLKIILELAGGVAGVVSISRTGTT